jgi:heme-degrading monooxygenase HmoA
MEVIGMTVSTTDQAPGTAGEAREPTRRLYLVRTEMLVRAGYTADFERQQMGMAESALVVAGFLGGSLLRSYSHPAKYVVTSSFESVEAAWAFGKSDVFMHAMKSEPAGAVTITQQEGYDLAREVVAEPLPEVGCEILIDEVLKGPEVIPAFEATLGQLFEVRRTHSAGYGHNSLYRSGGRLGRYLVIQGYTDLAAAGSANMPADVQAFIHDHPADLYTDKEVFPEAYAVISRV